MKRNLAITATTAMLALSLAGCGAERNGDIDLLPDFDGGGAGTGTTATDTMQNGTNSLNGTGTNAGASTNGGLNSVTGAVNRGTTNNSTQYGNARYGATSRDYAHGSSTYGIGGPNSGAYTATNNGGLAGSDATVNEKDAAGFADRYALMLANGRVHDTDGYLLDGENTSYRTF